MVLTRAGFAGSSGQRPPCCCGRAAGTGRRSSASRGPAADRMVSGGGHAKGRCARPRDQDGPVEPPGAVITGLPVDNVTSSSPGLRRPQGAGSDLGALFGPWPGTRRNAESMTSPLWSQDSRHPSQRRSFVPRDVRELGAQCVEVQTSTIRAPLETGAAQGGAGSQDTSGARGASAQSCGRQAAHDAWSMGKPDPLGGSEVGAGGSTPAGGDPWGGRPDPGPGFLTLPVQGELPQPQGDQGCASACRTPTRVQALGQRPCSRGELSSRKSGPASCDCSPSCTAYTLTLTVSDQT